MSNHADTEAYQAMITALNTFQSEIEAVADSLKNATQDCIDNMDQDAHAIKRTEQIQENIPRLTEAAGKAGELAKAIQRELQIILEIQ